MIYNHIGLLMHNFDIVSDFGFGTRRAESEALVASLQPSYTFQQLRIQGDYVRVLRAHPGKWQVGFYTLVFH